MPLSSEQVPSILTALAQTEEADGEVTETVGAIVSTASPSPTSQVDQTKAAAYDEKYDDGEEFLEDEAGDSSEEDDEDDI